MRYSKIITAGCAAAVFFMSAGCEKAPQVEIDKAKAAIGEIEAEASIYAAELLAKAKNQMDAALAASKAEEQKLIRDFSPIKKQFTDVETAAAEIKNAIAANKEIIQTEAAGIITQAKAVVEEAKQACMAIKNKVAAGPVTAIVAEADSAMVKADMFMNNGDFVGSKAQATLAVEKANQAVADADAAKRIIK